MSLSFRKHLVFSLLPLICFNLNNGCPKNKYDPLDCNKDFPRCPTGGVCDHVDGCCICPPRYSGIQCKTVPPPMNFRVMGANDNSITVEWAAPDPPHRRITNYDISYWESITEEPSSPTNSNTNETSTRYVLSGLTTNSTYSIKVRAKTSTLNSEWSITINATAKKGVPGPVVNFRSTNQTEMSITLEWDQPLNPNGQVKQYVVEYRAMKKLHQVDFTAGSEYVRKKTRKEQFTFKGLEPTTKYEFKISAENQRYTGFAATLLVCTKPPETKMQTELIVPVVLFGVVVVILVIYIKLRKAHNDDSSRPMEVLEISNNQIPPVMELQPTTAVRLIEDKHIYENIGLPTWAIDWEIKWKHLVVEDTILGKGNFGEVRLGRVNTKEKVTKAAVKTLKGGVSQDAADNFLEEFQKMTVIGLHPNIVGLLGACFNEGTLYVALEFLPGDNLRKYLRENRQIQLQGQHSQRKDSPVTLSQLLKFGVDVSKGMQHLAEAGIIHRDLAARNILLGEELIAKVSDFGLARGESIYVQESKTRIPLRWLAFESLTHHLYVSKSDVWSFGVLLWEIVTFGGTPYPGIHSRELPGKIIDGYRMPRPENCPDVIYNLMLNCWKKAPNKRPSFKEITDALEKIRQVLAIKTNTSLAIYENFSVIVQEFDDN